jgi:hypothetical protein
MKTIYKLTMLSMIFLAACSSGKKHLEKGNYNLAVLKAVNRLQQSPNHNKASKALKEAYSLAVKGHLDRVAYFEKTSDIFKHDGIVSEYEQILKLNNAIKRYPKYQSVVRLREVEDEHISSRNKAAEVHVAKGNKMLEMQTQDAARIAYSHFADANNYVRGIVSEARMEKVRRQGTVIVKLNFINNRSFFKTFNTKLFYNEVRNRFKNTNHRFLYVIEDDENLEFDEVIDVELNEVLVSGISRVSNTKIYTKRVMLGKVENEKGEVIKEYGEVEAEYTIYNNSLSSSAILMIARKNYGSESPQFKKIIPSTYTWNQEWARFAGDERALTKEQIEMAEISEPSIPNPLFMMEQATAPLINDCSTFLWTQYNYLR